jgi:fatty-acyl-CoA synthase
MTADPAAAMSGDRAAAPAGPLLHWLQAPRPGHGLRFAHDGGWSEHDYPGLAEAVRTLAGRLQGSGLAREDVCCLVLPTGPGFVTGLFATWLAGGTACPIAPPAPFQEDTAYVGQLASVFRAARPAQVLTSSGNQPLVDRALGQAALPVPVLLVSDDPPAPGGCRAVAPAEVALLQFTSGSSGRPRGVEVTAAGLAANVAGIRDWLGMGPADGTASWLPLYHDMGLIGCLLTPVVNQSTAWLMRPDQFIRDPARWLECLGDGRAVCTASPTFGYAYTVKRVNPGRLAGLDFSRWKAAIVGAEPLDARVLQRFGQLLAPLGFRGFLPAYGLAEATLLVTGRRRGDAIKIVHPDWSQAAFGERAPLQGQATLGEVSGDDLPGWLVSCGRPWPGTEVRILGAGGTPVPDGHLGEIAVRGPSVAKGYRGGDTVGSSRFDGAELRTGDAGFLLGGELFVAGRIGDSLKVRGRTVYVEDLDVKVRKATGLGPGRAVIVSSASQGRPGVALVAEASPGPWVATALEVLRAEIGPEPSIQVITGSRGLIARGSSGKPRRRHMWQQLQAGRLKGTIAADSGGAGGVPAGTGPHPPPQRGST